MLSSTNLRTLASKAISQQQSRQGAALLNASRRFYHENIVEHYENPRNVGSLNKDDDNVGTVSPRSSPCKGQASATIDRCVNVVHVKDTFSYRFLSFMELSYSPILFSICIRNGSRLTHNRDSSGHLPAGMS